MELCDDAYASPKRCTLPSPRVSFLMSPYQQTDLIVVVIIAIIRTITRKVTLTVAGSNITIVIRVLRFIPTSPMVSLHTAAPLPYSTAVHMILSVALLLLFLLFLLLLLCLEILIYY
jgi:hypothetical protein